MCGLWADRPLENTNRTTEEKRVVLNDSQKRKTTGCGQSAKTTRRTHNWERGGRFDVSSPPPPKKKITLRSLVPNWVEEQRRTGILQYSRHNIIVIIVIIIISYRLPLVREIEHGADRCLAAGTTRRARTGRGSAGGGTEHAATTETTEMKTEMKTETTETKTDAITARGTGACESTVYGGDAERNNAWLTVSCSSTTAGRSAGRGEPRAGARCDDGLWLCAPPCRQKRFSHRRRRARHVCARLARTRCSPPAKRGVSRWDRTRNDGVMAWAVGTNKNVRVCVFYKYYLVND